MSAPLFVAIEGTDGSGTTTQGDMLADALRQRGHRVHRTLEPSDRPVGRLLRQALRGQLDGRLAPPVVALLFAADRVDHCEREIGPALAQGTTVICDRYLGSSLTFQSIDGEGVFEPSWVQTINRPILEPDLSVLVDVPTDVAMARIIARGKPLERFEVAAFLRRVRARYLEVFQDPVPGLGPVAIVDGNRDRALVAADVLRAVERCAGRRGEAGP